MVLLEKVYNKATHELSLNVKINDHCSDSFNIKIVVILV